MAPVLPSSGTPSNTRPLLKHFSLQIRSMIKDDVKPAAMGMVPPETWVAGATSATANGPPATPTTRDLTTHGSLPAGRAQAGPGRLLNGVRFTNHHRDLAAFPPPPRGAAMESKVEVIVQHQSRSAHRAAAWL